jgi:Acetyltransferases, including N-acetylases of ribosomal proteins
MIIADAHDAPLISAMANEICFKYYNPIVDNSLVKYYVETFQSEEAVHRQIEKEGYIYSFILCDNEKVGYFSVHPENDRLLMSKLYLKEEYRGKGLGSKAIDDILEYGRTIGVNNVYLHVNKNNIPSINIYKAKGFEIVKYDDSEIGNGFRLDDYIMEYRFVR